MENAGTLDKEFQFYLANKDEFLEKYEGKFLVIRGEEVIGVFDDKVEAIDKTREKFPLGTFLVQHINRDKILFHSRVRIKKGK